MKLDGLTEIIIGLAIKIHRIDKRIIVECKATREITEIDQAQVLNYLKIADIRIGLLINFNEILLKDGLKRLANKYNDNE
jgi:hypothetical protein